MKWIQSHTNTLITIVVIGALVGAIYLPRMFNSPIEWVHSYRADCNYALKTNLSVKDKCTNLQNSFENQKANLLNVDRAWITYILARYNYTVQELPNALKYCTESIQYWSREDAGEFFYNSGASEPYNNPPKFYIGECQQMLQKHQMK